LGHWLLPQILAGLLYSSVAVGVSLEAKDSKTADEGGEMGVGVKIALLVTGRTESILGTSKAYVGENDRNI
jgi:hypothetical protein